MVVCGCMTACLCNTRGVISPSNTIPVADNQTTFLAAVKCLEHEVAVGGNDNGWGGSWPFYRCFGDIFRNGNSNAFLQLCAHTNPVMQTMGLLCLKYTDRQLAADVAARLCGSSQEVHLMHADLGTIVPLEYVAHTIMSDYDFCDTLTAAERIKAEQRGEIIREASFDTNDVIVIIH
jgi:hypothetical protein